MSATSGLEGIDCYILHTLKHKDNTCCTTEAMATLILWVLRAYVMDFLERVDKMHIRTNETGGVVGTLSGLLYFLKCKN